MARNILYDIPRSAGVQNMIDRARRVTEFKWTPTQELYYQETRTGVSFYAPCCNGKAPEKPEEQVGIPYSSARIANKFVGIDITFDTFLTAVQNPHPFFISATTVTFLIPTITAGSITPSSTTASFAVPLQTMCMIFLSTAAPMNGAHPRIFMRFWMEPSTACSWATACW